MGFKYCRKCANVESSTVRHSKGHPCLITIFNKRDIIDCFVVGAFCGFLQCNLPFLETFHLQSLPISFNHTWWMQNDLAFVGNYVYYCPWWVISEGGACTLVWSRRNSNRKRPTRSIFWRERGRRTGLLTQPNPNNEKENQRSNIIKIAFVISSS